LKTDTNLSEIFDIEVNDAPKGVTRELVIKDEVAQESVDSDFEQARKNLQLLLMQGEDALMGALEVAKQSEHPRAFEVVGTLIKQMADVNQQMMDLHKQKQQLDNPKGSAEGNKKVTNNNAIFVGSTADLNKMISKMNKE
jgi:hypothetical protein